MRTYKNQIKNLFVISQATANFTLLTSTSIYPSIHYNDPKANQPHCCHEQDRPCRREERQGPMGQQEDWQPRQD